MADTHIDTCGQALGAAAHAEAASARAVLRECLTDGASACAEFTEMAARLAAMFRQGDAVSGGAALATLANDLRTFVAFINAVHQWIGDDAPLHIDGNTPDQQIALVSEWVESLIAAHANADWLTLADILDYDLEPFLRAWRDRLTQLAS